ncbi:hypothetical protein L3X38_044904 [Prunus dulcis]|uniref:Uncharacterized protein n=1 Tax=Prunus dulcis TaxID=3755 RepID=A0AAD4YPD4_PRUDU|nr:hypothetical protein L3X38_044904 [Prunus dulcis]
MEQNREQVAFAAERVCENQVSSLCVWHHGTVLMVKRANVACRKKLKVEASGVVGVVAGEEEGSDEGEPLRCITTWDCTSVQACKQECSHYASSYGS